MKLSRQPPNATSKQATERSHNVDEYADILCVTDKSVFVKRILYWKKYINDDCIDSATYVMEV